MTSPKNNDAIRTIHYMLDTTTVIDAMKRKKYPNVIERLLQHEPSEIAISVITLAELEFGNVKSSNPLKNRLAMLAFLAGITVLPLEENVVFSYGRIRYKLEKQGIQIGGNDLLIATHALSLGLILVTSNTREFSRIEELQVKDWRL